MPPPKATIYDPDTARFFRRTARFFDTELAILNVNKIQTSQQVRDLLKKKPPRDQSKIAMAKYENQILRFEAKWEFLPIGLQAIRFAAGMFKALMREEGNKSLIPKKQISNNKIHKIIEEPINSKNRRSLQGRGVVTLLVSNEFKKGVGFEELKGTHEYRDPSKQRSGDPIHQGARAKFKRYAITELQISGKKLSAGRKGTMFEGLGLEPPLSKLPNRASVSSKSQYLAFKRVGYPGRSSPDTITNEIRFPLHYHIIERKDLRSRIIKRCVRVVTGVYKDYQKATTAILIKGARNIKNIGI